MWAIGTSCRTTVRVYRNQSINKKNQKSNTHLTGARAAQVVPHVHFHIIPRVGGVDDVPEVKARSWTVFGKGQREELDEEDAVVLVGRMRERLRGEVERVRRREGEGAVRRLFAGGGGSGEGTGMGSKL